MVAIPFIVEDTEFILSRLWMFCQPVILKLAISDDLVVRILSSCTQFCLAHALMSSISYWLNCKLKNI